MSFTSNYAGGRIDGDERTLDWNGTMRETNFPNRSVPRWHVAAAAVAVGINAEAGCEIPRFESVDTVSDIKILQFVSFFLAAKMRYSKRASCLSLSLIDLDSMATR